MKKFVSIFFLLIGLVIGGSAMWYFTRPSAEPVAQKEAKQERKVLYYRNPMDPAVTSPAPMKDPMGMDYIPVYEEKAAAAPGGPGTVRLAPERIQRIGVKSEEARRLDLKRVIRTVGRVEPVEDRVYLINAKISGWVERLYVSRTDQMVSRGEKLLELYSPELVSAQEEYLLALKSLKEVQDSPYSEVKSRAGALVEAARQRLKYWDISEDQIERLKIKGEVSRTLAIKAPAGGSVTEKMVVEGQKIEAGEPIFKIIDHSAVWVYGEIYEYEMPYIKTGQRAILSPAYSSTEVYKGKIEHIYSHLGSIRYAPEEGTEVRTAKVRFELPNPGHRLKLGMYLNIEIASDIAKKAVAIPESALIDSGERQVVIIDNRDGTFTPMEVTIGARAEDFYEVVRGLKEGEWVVTSANFLVDSESNLRSAISSIGAAENKTGKGNPSPSKGHGH